MNSYVSPNSQFGTVGKDKVFHLTSPPPVASCPDQFYIGSEGDEEGEEEKENEPNTRKVKFRSRSETATDLSKEKLRPKKNGISGRLYVGEAMDGGPQRDEAASAAPLPPEDQEDGQPAQPLVRHDRPTPEMIVLRMRYPICPTGVGVEHVLLGEEGHFNTRLPLRSQQSLLRVWIICTSMKGLMALDCQLWSLGTGTPKQSSHTCYPAKGRLGRHTPRAGNS